MYRDAGCVAPRWRLGDYTSQAAASAATSRQPAARWSELPRRPAVDSGRLLAFSAQRSPSITAFEHQHAARCGQPLDPVSSEFRTVTAYFECLPEERQGRVGFVELLFDGQAQPTPAASAARCRAMWRTRTGECRRATESECGTRRGRVRCAPSVPTSDRAALRRATRHWAAPTPARYRGTPRPAGRASPSPSPAPDRVRRCPRRSGWVRARHRDFPTSMWEWRFQSLPRPGCSRSHRGCLRCRNLARTMRKLKPRCSSSARKYSAQLALSKTQTSPMVTASG